MNNKTLPENLADIGMTGAIVPHAVNPDACVILYLESRLIGTQYGESKYYRTPQYSVGYSLLEGDGKLHARYPNPAAAKSGIGSLVESYFGQAQASGFAGSRAEFAGLYRIQDGALVERI